MVRLKGFQKLTSVDEALRTFSKNVHIKKPHIIHASLHSALNRVLAEDIIAEDDLPRFDRSAVDGYAAKAEDTNGASQFKPKPFSIVDKNEVHSKQAKHVWTGNAIPKGADAVVMLENTEQTDNALDVWVPLTPGENISKRGEDIKRGEIAVKAGTRIKPQHL